MKLPNLSKPTPYILKTNDAEIVFRPVNLIEMSEDNISYDSEGKPVVNFSVTRILASCLDGYDNSLDERIEFIKSIQLNSQQFSDLLQGVGLDKKKEEISIENNQISETLSAS